MSLHNTLTEDQIRALRLSAQTIVNSTQMGSSIPSSHFYFPHHANYLQPPSDVMNIGVIGDRTPSIVSQNQSTTANSSFYRPLPVIPHNMPPIPHPHVLDADLVLGSKTQRGYMSPMRRFFCLLSFFDFLFTSLLWGITVILTGRNLIKAFTQQVLHYSVHASMFDCVMAAFSRFVFVILFYAVLDLNHWWPISLSTGLTSLFMCYKVVVYHWSVYSPPTFDVLLIIISFVLSWIELWFVDCRLLPVESRISQLNQYLSVNQDTQLDRSMLFRYLNTRDCESVVEHATFYSPLESPTSEKLVKEDDNNVDVESLVIIPSKFVRPPNKPLTSQERVLVIKGEECLRKALNRLNSTQWREEQSRGKDVVYSNIVSGKKIFKLQFELEIPARLLFEELHFKFESVPTWNSTLLECKHLQMVDNHTDVSYQRCAPSGGGSVKSRDFVIIRHWKSFATNTAQKYDGGDSPQLHADKSALQDEHNTFVSAFTSVSHSTTPPQKDVLRGEHGDCCVHIQTISTSKTRELCKVEIIVDTDLKGWIPRRVVDSAISSVQLSYAQNVRQHVESMKTSGILKNYQQTFTYRLDRN